MIKPPVAISSSLIQTMENASGKEQFQLIVLKAMAALGPLGTTSTPLEKILAPMHPLMYLLVNRPNALLKTNNSGMKAALQAAQIYVEAPVLANLFFMMRTMASAELNTQVQPHALKDSSEVIITTYMKFSVQAHLTLDQVQVQILLLFHL